VDLSGKTMLVTGGGRGIGAAIVRNLLDCGAHVILHYSRARDQSERIAAIAPDRCLLVRADLVSADSTLKLWDDAVAWKGRIDVLVNNAGLVTPATIDDEFKTWLDTWQTTIQVNLFAVAVLCRKAIHAFRASGGGILINIASRAAFRGDDPHLMHYAASKGGIVALTRSIARGYAHDNILAYVVAPGFVRTERQEDVIAARGEQTMIHDIPLGEMARPEDVARVVAFLSSGLARHATGATIDINGASYVH
jgi:3-oxoacyl-[acyl-carrier protein] reductase